MGQKGVTSIKPITKHRLLIIFVVIIIVVLIIPILTLPAFTPPDITTLVFSAAAFIIAFANFFYNSWKEPNLEPSGYFKIYRSDKRTWIYFIRFKNVGRDTPIDVPNAW